MNNTFVNANPYPWPYNGDLQPSNTALVVIDMQIDFCGVGGYVDKMGYDISLTRAPIAPIKALMARMRTLGFTIIHTREGHRPDLSDLPANKRWRSRTSAPMASASATTARAGASSFAANRAGTSSKNSPRSPARSSSTNPAKARSARPISN